MGTNTIYLLVVISTFFWGANFVLAGAVMADLPALWAAALRFLLGAAIMWALTRGRGENLAGPGRRHGWAYAVLGMVGVGGFNLLFFFALQHTSADNAALIMATNPLLTTLLAALLLGERPTSRQLAALPLALAGVAVVISGGDPQRLAQLHINAGDLLMVGADLTWAFYNVLSRRFMPGGSAMVNTTWIMTAGAALLLAVALGSGENVSVPEARAGMALAGMAVGGTVIAYLFWNMGIARLGAGRTALFLNLVPVFAMLVGAAVGTAPTPAQIVGGLLVIGGVSIAMLPRRRLATA
jgi:drug/metabolite transporter (DMT)-like permease